MTTAVGISLSDPVLTRFTEILASGHPLFHVERTSYGCVRHYQERNLRPERWTASIRVLLKLRYTPRNMGV